MSHSGTISCDFGGTVTQEGIVEVLLTELVDPQWRRIEAEWQRDAIGSRECLALERIVSGWEWPFTRGERIRTRSRTYV